MTWYKTVYTTPIFGQPNIFFTTCCDISIKHEQDNCPKCGEEIRPKGRVARINAVRFIYPEHVR